MICASLTGTACALHWLPAGDMYVQAVKPASRGGVSATDSLRLAHTSVQTCLHIQAAAAGHEALAAAVAELASVRAAAASALQRSASATAADADLKARLTAAEAAVTAAEEARKAAEAAATAAQVMHATGRDNQDGQACSHGGDTEVNG